MKFESERPIAMRRAFQRSPGATPGLVELTPFLSVSPDIAAAAGRCNKPCREMADDPAVSGPYRIASPQEQKSQGENQMSFSRRALLKASAASAVLGGIGAPFVARAQAAEFTYKYANNLPDAHPMNARAEEMSAAIKTENNV